MVDEAKAFCPGCGHSFVDEKQRETYRTSISRNRTVQLGETMFNQMLSEMGLSISRQPNRDENRENVVEPLAPASTAPSVERKEQTLPAPEAKRKKILWIVAIVLAAVVFAIVVMLATVAGLVFFYR
jgi:t-SNARE complex subunit (syntaxin)